MGDDLVQYDEFEQAIPILEEWGISIDNPLEAFAYINQDLNHDLDFTHFSRWALAEGDFNNPHYRDALGEDGFDGVEANYFRRQLAESIYEGFAHDRSDLFRRLDTNGDRRLSKEEFEAGILRIGIRFTEQ